MSPKHLMIAATLLTAPMAMAQTAPPSVLLYTQALSPGAATVIQERLSQAGVYAGRADGIWGPDSQAALERFQASRSLQVTGSLNQATVATLGVVPAELLSTRQAIAPAAASVPETLSPGAIRNVQTRLRALGFYRGAPDGLWGAGTQTAIERFQQGRGLQPTGQVNPATVQALGLDPNNPGGAFR